MRALPGGVPNSTITFSELSHSPNPQSAIRNPQSAIRNRCILAILSAFLLCGLCISQVFFEGAPMRLSRLWLRTLLHGAIAALIFLTISCARDSPPRAPVAFPHRAHVGKSLSCVCGPRGAE